MSDAYQGGAFQGDAFQIGGPQSGGGGGPPTITVTSGAITLTGSSTNLKRALRLSVSTAAITLTGTSVNLKRGYRITATSSAVTLTGTSVVIRSARRIAATSAAVTLSGTSVALRAARKLAATSSAVTLTGSSVTLTYTPVASAFTLTVDTGSIILSGSLVSLTAGSNAITGGGHAWKGPAEPQYRVHPDYEDKPKKKRRKVTEPETIVLAPDLTVQTGIVPVRPAWDVMAEIQQRTDEAERIRRAKLRAIALADDDWLMVA